MNEKGGSFGVPMMVTERTDNTIKTKDELEKSIMNSVTEFYDNTGVLVTGLCIDYSFQTRTVSGKVSRQKLVSNITFTME